MKMTVWQWLTAMAAGLSIAACGGKEAPEPAAPEPVTPAEQPSGSDVAPTEPEPASEAATQPPPDPAAVKAELMAAEKAAFELAEPVFKQHCAKCHVKGNKKAKAKTLEHFDMTTYPFGGHHANEITGEIRKVLGIGGGKPTMPMDDPGAVKGDELSLITAWADAYDKAEGGGAHEDRHENGTHDHKSGHKH